MTTTGGFSMAGAPLRRRLGLGLLALVLAGGAAGAGEPVRGLRFGRVGVDDGLSQETVFAIAQDPHGFLWIATQGGLNRYDGYDFTTYRHDDADPHSLTDNWVAALCVDERGRLWVATVSGLDRFEPGTNTFSHFKTSDRQPTPRLWAVVSDGAGGVWAGTADGLVHVDHAGTTTVLRNDPKDLRSLGANLVRALERDSSGNLWVGTTTGLDRLAAGANQFDHFRLDAGSPPGSPRNGVRALACDRQGNLWIGTDDGLDFRSADGAVRRHYGAREGLARGTVGSIVVDDAGDVWVGIFEHGIARWDPAAGRFFAYHNDPLDPHSITSDVVNVLFSDRSGVLWVGSWFGGLSRTDLAAGGFNRLVHLATDANSLSENTVVRIHADRSGRLWMGTRAGGLDAYDPATGRVTRYRHDPADAASLSGDFVRAMLDDGHGGLLVGTGSGFDRLDPASGVFTRMTLDWPAGNRDVRILTRGPHGRIWIGTGSGIVSYDPERKTAERYTADPRDPASLSQTFVNALLFDRRGTLWVATFSNGLDRLDRTENGRAHFSHFTSRPADPRSLSSNRTYCLFEDHTGTLWVGTANGLNRAVPDGAGRISFRRYGTKEGLLDEQVYGIEEDGRGRLWLGTGGGLSEFDPVTGRVRNYTASDGLIDGTYALGSYDRTPDGTLFFGGFNGVTFFRPGEVRQNPIPPQVAITDISIFNESVNRVRPAGFALDGPLALATAMTLSYRSSVFAIEFAGLHFGNPRRNRYAYRLEGFDRDWVRTDAAHRLATYTNLDPGHYVFRVRAASGNGVWSEHNVALAIDITPPFWRTWWFRVLVAGLAGGSLIAWYQARLRHFARQRARLEEQVAARTAQLAQSNRQLADANQTLDRQAKDLERQNEILAENVRLKDDVERISRHDLRTPLNSIISLAQILREDRSLTREQEESLQLIEQAGYRVLNMANLTLDLFKMEQGTYLFTPKAVDIRAIAERAWLDLRSLARTYDVSCTIGGEGFGPEEVPLVRGDELLAHSMLTNLLKNAIEASPRGAGVTVTLVRRELVQVRIHNQGVIPEAIRGRFFQKYATRGKKGGTGLGAYSAGLMAAMQGGRIRFETSAAAGTTLVVELTAASPAERVAASAIDRSPPAPVPDERPARRILVVDDDADNRAILRTFLAHPNWTVDEAENGVLALELVKDHAYDFVLLDIEMPVVDGFDVAGKIAGLVAAPNGIPLRPTVVALSSHDDQATRERALGSGFDRYITKPVTRRALVELVLGSASSTVTLEADVRHLIPAFIGNKLEELRQIHTALAAGDGETVRRGFHRLQGGFSLYGFAGAARLCAEFEALAGAGDLAQVTTRQPELYDYLNRLDIRYVAKQSPPP